MPSKPTTRQCPEVSGPKQTYNKTVPRGQWCQANLQQDSAPRSVVPSKPTTRQCPEVSGAKQTYSKIQRAVCVCDVLIGR